MASPMNRAIQTRVWLYQTYSSCSAVEDWPSITTVEVALVTASGYRRYASDDLVDLVTNALGAVTAH